MGRLRDAPAWSLAAVLAGLYLLLEPPAADLAAQIYRVELFEREGYALWDNGWYAGHHLPAYSLVFPPLGALLGVRVAGALAAVAAAVLFERLVGPRRRVAALWFAVGSATLLVTGRLTFACGVAIGLAALLTARNRRPFAAGGLAVLTTLASPVAGAFLALAGVATAIADRRRLGLIVAACALAPAGLMALAFPEGGSFPFEADSFWPGLAATLLVLAVVPARLHALRVGIALYAGVLALSYFLDTPMGGNAVRLGALTAGPIAAAVLWPLRKRTLLLLAPALLYWQWSAPVDDWLRAERDPSVHAKYYRGLNEFLTTQPGPFRVEIPFTDNHWESLYVARRFPLARGWERQLDRHVNGLFYEGALTPARYERWLHETAVRFVALHDAPVDYSAAGEARLVREGLPYLREVFRDDNWRVYEVAGARPLADGARLAALRDDEVVLDAPRAGRVLLRVRWTPYWKVAEGSACVARAGDWTALQIRAPGRVRLVTEFAFGRIRAERARCSTALRPD